LGEERLLTGVEAGTTRDAIAVDLDWHGRQFRLHDTAGLRRRSRIEAKLEKLSVADALNALRFAEVVILLLDAQRPFEEQDLRIADLVEREGRGLVIGMNKWDLVEPRPGAIKKLREEGDHLLPQVRGVPVVPISGLTGEGLERLMQAASDAHAVWNRRTETSVLNRWLGEVVATHPPPAVCGPPHPAGLHHPAEEPSSHLRAVHKPRGCCARGVPPLPGQQPARELRSAGHPDPTHPAREEEPLREKKASAMPARVREKLQGPVLSSDKG